MSDNDTDGAMDRSWLDHAETGVSVRLAQEYAGTFSAETVERYVKDSRDRWADVRITTYLPIMIERFARQRLRALAKVEGGLVSDLPEVLFVCVHNAGRSQMAAALLDHHAEGRVLVRSAGSTPADQVNPAVIAAMDEVGVDLSKEFPKPLTDRESATSTGSSTIPPARAWTTFGPFATRSTPGYGASWPSWRPSPVVRRARGRGQRAGMRGGCH
jgi:hypothetical protein